jgi:phosphoserine phosphatase RsbU/P
VSSRESVSADAPTRLDDEPLTVAAEGVIATAEARAGYLNDLTGAVSALSHPARGVETFVAGLVDDLVDLAQVAVRTHQGWLVAGQVRGHRMVDVHTYEVGRNQGRVMKGLLQQRQTETWLLPPDTPQRAEVLGHLFGTTELLHEVESLHAATLLIIPMVARGRCFGLVVMARRAPLGFDDGYIAFLEQVVGRIAVSLDACCVVSDNRHVASTLRRSLLPRALPSSSRLDVASYSRVAQEDITVGGDFIDLHGSGDDQTLLIGDAVGKGVAAAIAAKRIRSAVRTGSIVDRDPAFVMGLTNRVIVSEDDDVVESLATAVCARLQREDDVLTVTLVNAGHPLPIVLRTDGTVQTVGGHGPALGIFDDARYESQTVVLAPGDLLLLYTDGVTEARGERDLFGEVRLREVLAGLAGAPASALVEAVAMSISQFASDSEDRDDTAIVAVRLLP